MFPARTKYKEEKVTLKVSCIDNSMCTVAESNFVPKKTNNKSSQMSTNSMRSSIQIISLARTSVLGSATDTINFFNIFFYDRSVALNYRCETGPV